MNVSHDASARIARWNNKLFREYVGSASKGYLQGTPLELDEEEMKQVLKEATARYILLEIGGEWDDEDGPIEHSVERMVRLFDDFPELYETITGLAQQLDEYRESHIEETVGNSSSTLSGACGGVGRSRSSKPSRRPVCMSKRSKIAPLCPNTKQATFDTFRT